MIRIIEMGHVSTAERDTFAFLCDPRSVVIWRQAFDRIEPLADPKEPGSRRFALHWSTGVLRHRAEILTRYDRLNRQMTMYCNRDPLRFSASMQVFPERDGSRIVMETKVYVTGPLRLLRGRIEREVVRRNRLVMEALASALAELPSRAAARSEIGDDRIAAAARSTSAGSRGRK